MSSGGTVPSQGTTKDALSPAVKQQVEQAAKRGPRGDLGPGSRSLTLKGAWRASSQWKGKSLKQFVRALAGSGNDVLSETAKVWLANKTGRPQRLAAREARKERQAARRPAQSSAKVEIKVPKGKGR